MSVEIKQIRNLGDGEIEVVAMSDLRPDQGKVELENEETANLIQTAVRKELGSRCDFSDLRPAVTFVDEEGNDLFSEIVKAGSIEVGSSRVMKAKGIFRMREQQG